MGIYPHTIIKWQIGLEIALFSKFYCCYANKDLTIFAVLWLIYILSTFMLFLKEKFY